MEKNYDMIELSKTELEEINGGLFPMLLIRLFGPSVGGILGFRDGLREGYARTTQEQFKLLKSKIMERLSVIELELDEMITIDGGKSLGYYLGYAVGAIAGTTVSFVAGVFGGLQGVHI